MHPDTARQLAAERHADFRRERPVHAASRPRAWRWRLRRGTLRYAGAATGLRSGT
jgi:hypothetical protein